MGTSPDNERRLPDGRVELIDTSGWRKCGGSIASFSVSASGRSAGVHPGAEGRDDFRARYPAALPVRVEKVSARGLTFYRIVGILWGGPTPRGALSIRLNSDLSFAPVEQIGSGRGTAWTLWSHTFRPQAPGRYRIELAVRDAAVRARRLDVGFYAREIEIAGV